MTPHQLRHLARKKRQSIQKHDALEAASLSAAIEKYVGGVDIANTELGIAPKRQTKWSKIILQNAVDQCVNVYGLSPTQLLYDHRKNKVELSDEKVVQLKQMIDAISRYPGKIEAIYLELGIEAPKRARN